MIRSVVTKPCLGVPHGVPYRKRSVEPHPDPERVHRCPFCGYEQDRDVNAAINILQLARQKASSNSIRPGTGLRGECGRSRLDETRSSPFQWREVHGKGVAVSSSPDLCYHENGKGGHSGGRGRLFQASLPGMQPG
ncbi:hypothetical protein CHM34_12765 [Paludifilum halophilum]|uniref:Cas12f1-like TNB domain-containing protein n=1 Tax=Paludifilum halophilum TaxID=1642702 RepID=A0A235B4L3_9BACL|nr:hypothetical protein CHM34_12765 [Paludifilum halophilum]